MEAKNLRRRSASTAKKSRSRTRSRSRSVESNSDSSGNTVLKKKVVMGPPFPPKPARPTLLDVVKDASAAIEVSENPYVVPAIRSVLASSSKGVTNGKMDIETENVSVEKVVKVPTVYSDVSDITAMVALGAINEMNAYVVKEFAGGHAQELLRLSANMSDLVMRLLMSNIELSGSKAKSQDGTVLAAAAKRSRSEKRSQQRKASRSRTKSKARSKSRPMTYSAVIKGAVESMPNEEIKKLMATKEAPARVKNIKDHKDGGVLVETCSKKELDDLLDSFKEIDELVAQAAPPRKPRLVVMGVPSSTEIGVFMGEVWTKNVKDTMDLASFQNACNVVSLTAKGDLVLEVEQAIYTKWMRQRRIFVQWCSYGVRPFMETRANVCFKCYGFGHHKSACKESADLCRKCGLAGHHADKCVSEASCKNCKAMGKPHNHSVTSVSTCPIYGQAHLRSPKFISNSNAE